MLSLTSQILFYSIKTSMGASKKYCFPHKKLSKKNWKNFERVYIYFLYNIIIFVSSFINDVMNLEYAVVIGYLGNMFKKLQNILCQS